MTLSGAPGGVALPALLTTRSNGNGHKPSARAANGTATVEPPRAGHRVSFVLPAYNEEGNILRAIDNTVVAASRYCGDYEVIVVDDGSRDGTAELVERAAADNPSIRLVRHPTNRGYGDALRTGFSSATLDFVFFTDADNQFDMNELPLLLEWADDADVVAGYRKQRRDPAMRRLNAWAWNRLVRALFCVPVRDIDCAFKLFRRSALAGLTIESRGAMINTEIMVKLSRAGNTVVEVGVTHLPRTEGEGSGADLKVILRAFNEVSRMYPMLADLAPVRRARPDALVTS
jgi:glycosyltransferase involved in cell wall biosynthesis